MPTPAPRAPAAPRRRAPAVVLVLLLAAGALYWVNPKPPTPPSAQSLPPAPAPAPEAAAVALRWSIAAMAANRYTRAEGNTKAGTLVRGDVVEVLEQTAGRARVRTADGQEFWIDPQVAVPQADAARLAAADCETYAERNTQDFGRRWAALGLDRLPGELSLEQLDALVRNRDPQIDERLQAAVAARQPAEGADVAAAIWYRWDMRYAQQMGRNAADPVELARWNGIALRCARASAYADPSDLDSLTGWVLAAHRNGERPPEPARWAPYLAPTQSNAWALYMLAAAADSALAADIDLLSGAAVQLLRQTQKRSASLKFLNELQPGASPALQSAIQRAIDETDPAPRPSAPRPAPGAPPATVPAEPAWPTPATPTPAPAPAPVPAPPPAQPPAPLPSPAPGDLRLQVLLTMGETALARGDYAQARTVAREALQLSPADPRVRSLAERARKAEVDALRRIDVQ